MFDPEETPKFLAAFEAAEILCPSSTARAAPARAAGSVDGASLEDWTLVHGGAAAQILARPLVPRAPMALLQPSLAASYFEKLHAAGAEALAGESAAFLALAESTFRALIETHCHGQDALLPLSFRYHDGDVPRGGWVLRPSHVLEGSERALRGSFAPLVVESEKHLPAAVAAAALAFWRAPVDVLLESVSPEVHLHPGNVVLTPELPAKRGGILRVVSSESARAWAWRVAHHEGPARLVASGEAKATAEEGRGRGALVRAVPEFAALDAAFDAYVPGGREVVVEWEILEGSGRLVVLGWEEAEAPDPGVFGRDAARARFPTALTPFDASVRALLVRASDAGRARYLPLRRRARSTGAVIDEHGWLFERREGPFASEARPSFLAGLAAARVLGEKGAAWHAGRYLRRMALDWRAALDETLPRLDALEAACEGMDGRTAENAALLAAIEAASECARALAVFEGPITRWRWMLERAHGPRLPEGHLVTASESRRLMAKAPVVHLEGAAKAGAGAKVAFRSGHVLGADGAARAHAGMGASRVANAGTGVGPTQGAEEGEAARAWGLDSLATRQEREQAVASGSLTTIHALVVLMTLEWERYGSAALPLLSKLAALCAPRLGLAEDDVPYLAFKEIRAQLRLLESDLQAAGLSQSRLEHKVRLRVARHAGLREDDPAMGPIYGAAPDAEGASAGDAAAGDGDGYADPKIGAADHGDENDVPSLHAEPSRREGGSGLASYVPQTRSLPGPAVHVSSETDALPLARWPETEPRPVVIAARPYPWLSRYLPRLSGVVCEGGDALSDLALAARALGVPVVTGEGHGAFARYPESRRPAAPLAPGTRVTPEASDARRHVQGASSAPAAEAAPARKEGPGAVRYVPLNDDGFTGGT